MRRINLLSNDNNLLKRRSNTNEKSADSPLSTKSENNNLAMNAASDSAPRAPKPEEYHNRNSNKSVPRIHVTYRRPKSVRLSILIMIVCT